MGAPDLRQFSVTLTPTAELIATLGRETGALEVAKAFEITDNDMAALANGELRAIKERIAKLKELKAGFVAPAKQIVANAEALFDPAIEANTQAEGHIKGLLSAWTTEQQRLADEARRRAEEEARRARAEAEKKAAAERAKAEEDARISREKAAAAEAERKRQEEEATRARAAGDVAAAAEADRKAKAAAAEAAKREAEEKAKREAGEAKARETELSAASAPAPAVVAPAKLAGFSMRDNWTVELEPGKSEDDVQLAVVYAIAGVQVDKDGNRVLIAPRHELRQLLPLNMGAAGRVAKAQKQHTNIPGLKAVNKPVAASRKA